MVLAGPLPFIPPGLTYGDQFRIAFVTFDPMAATSTDIGDYNTFVNTQANLSGSFLAGLGVTWYAIGSTDSVNAIDNVNQGGPTDVPVYNLNLALLALTTDTDGMFNGSGALGDTLNVDQFGNPYNGLVFTGTLVLGQAFTEAALGDTLVAEGDSTAASSWIFGALGSSTDTLPLYGISGPITIPTPEPMTVGLLLAGGLLLVGVKRYQGVRRAS
jgi:hypothetical protein